MCFVHKHMQGYNWILVNTVLAAVLLSLSRILFCTILFVTIYIHNYLFN